MDFVDRIRPFFHGRHYYASQWMERTPKTGARGQSLNVLFRRCVSYRTYPLLRRYHRYDVTVADKMKDLAERLKPLMQCSSFSLEDEICVLSFLNICNRACEDTGTAESVAFPLIRYLLEEKAQSTLSSSWDQACVTASPG